ANTRNECPSHAPWLLVPVPAALPFSATASTRDMPIARRRRRAGRVAAILPTGWYNSYQRALPLLLGRALDGECGQVSLADGASARNLLISFSLRCAGNESPILAATPSGAP